MDFSNIWCDRYTNHHFSFGRLGEYYRFCTSPDISSSKSLTSTAEKELEKPLENAVNCKKVRDDKAVLQGDLWRILSPIGCELFSKMYTRVKWQDIRIESENEVLFSDDLNFNMKSCY